uniref:RNA polymerase Rpb5 N-terminal domain-containing protein n=1 Tax=Aplanochytrium stocchinoi TaxID=215587 RepID=A0A6S8FUP2_9STRA
MTNSSQLFRVRKTVIKMLINRKYLISPSDKNITLEEFHERFGNPVNKTLLTILVTKVDDPTDKLFVFFPVDEKLGVQPIKKYCIHMNQEQVKRAIIVVEDKISPFAKQGKLC